MTDSRKPDEAMMGKLIPEQQPVPERRSIPMAELPADEAMIGQKPDSDLIESISRFGVIEPIVVVNRPSKRGKPGGFDVIDGRRRIKAARHAGLERIPAVIYDELPEIVRGVLVVSLNNLRSDNPISELQAIEEMLRAGAGLPEISEATGLGKGSIEKRLKLAGLVSEIRQSIAQGKTAVSVGEAAAKLPEAVQRRLVAKMQARETGKIIMRDVDEEKEARRDQATSQVPMGVFAGPGIDWREETVNRLQEILRIVPTDDDKIRPKIIDILVELSVGKISVTMPDAGTPIQVLDVVEKPESEGDAPPF